MFGGYITAELEKVEAKDSKKLAAKRHQRLLKLLAAPDKMRFRSLRQSHGKQ